MSKKAVQVVPLQQGPSPWRVSHNGMSGDKPADYPKVTLPEHTGPYLISFKLSGNHSGITFSSDPIWVQEDDKPEEHSEHPQIPMWKVQSEGKELIVVNLNDNDPNKPPLQLHYRLNFDGHPDLDPIIENGGGSSSLTRDGRVDHGVDYTAFAVVAVIAFALGVLAYWGFRRVRG